MNRWINQVPEPNSTARKILRAKLIKAVYLLIIGEFSYTIGYLNESLINHHLTVLVSEWLNRAIKNASLCGFTPAKKRNCKPLVKQVS